MMDYTYSKLEAMASLWANSLGVDQSEPRSTNIIGVIRTELFHLRSWSSEAPETSMNMICACPIVSKVLACYEVRLFSSP